jgi:membrane protein
LRSHLLILLSFTHVRVTKEETTPWLMAAPTHQLRPSKPQPFPHKSDAGHRARISGELVVMAALIGLSRLFFGRKRKGVVARTVHGVEDVLDGSGRGRTAGKPTEIPPRGWKDIAWRVNDGLQNDRVLLVSAGVTFYALLALFPATAAIVSLYGLFADVSTINDHLALISGFLPEGALSVIGDQVKRITLHGQGTLGVAFIGTLGLSLWGANAGTKSIFDALNIIYKEREKRSFLQLTLRSLAFTVGAIILVLTALTGIVAVPLALKMLSIPEWSTGSLLTMLRWPVLYVMILFALACLHRYGPSRTHPQWKWVTWGSGLAAAIWIGGSLLLSWYVANFGNYNATYGSLGAVIGFMVWMWLSTVVVLIGGEINAEMEHQTARDTTRGGKPVGARRARMADEVGEARA